MQEAWNWGKIPQRRAHIFFIVREPKVKKQTLTLLYEREINEKPLLTARIGAIIFSNLRPQDLSDRHSPSPSSAYSWKR